MSNVSKKALDVVNRGTSKALNSKYLNRDNDNTEQSGNESASSQNKLHEKRLNPYNPYEHKYRSLYKRGFKYSVNPLAKYIYRNVDTSKESPNRKIKKMMMRTHNRLVLSHLSTDDKWDLPCVSYHRCRYYQVNALQYVYLLARAHTGTAVGLRKAVAEIIQSVINGGLTPEDVATFAFNHRGDNQ